MTTEKVIRVFEQRPFEPFVLCLADGREMHVLHPETATIGRSALIVYVSHPTRQIEIVDTALIVSIRSVYPADLQSWTA